MEFTQTLEGQEREDVNMDISCEQIEKKWQAMFEEGTLSSQDLRSYWKYFVPEIFSPQPNCNCLRITHEEDQAQKVLFDTLERFMCGGDPTSTYQMVRELDSPPSLCGKVFKSGGPTYSCRDCGMDPTCVLCAECFENSAHVKHRYKISTSSGGGYCDCGDREAWKNDVFCRVHIKGQQIRQPNQDILQKLPQDFVERVQFVFDTILQYAKLLLTYEDNFSLPKDLEIKDWERELSISPSLSLLSQSKDTYVTMLYNDESHTYDQVILALTRAIECCKKDAVAYATSIDREGRCIVRCSSFENCNSAKKAMDRPSSRTHANKPLKVQVVQTYIIAHQVFASRLLQWLHNVLEMAEAFRIIFNEIATRDNCLLIESIFWSDTKMWKTARIQWHRLFICGMLMEMESKKTFARVFTKHYSKMMKDFIQDDHDHSVCVVSLAVQLYTIPTIAHMLIAEEDVLVRLINTFLSECHKNVKNGKLFLNESRTRNIDTFKRIQYILYDLKYLLGIKPDTWVTELRKGFLAGFDKMIQLLTLMQSMDPMVRQVGQHMQFEPEWEAAFNLHIKLSSILPLLIEWAASDQVVLIKAYRMVLKALGEQTTEDIRRRYVQEFLEYSVSCIEYDVSSAPVSLHLPLSRLLAGLTIKLDKYDLTYNSVEFSVKGKPPPEELMEPVLRTQVMISQVNAGMWRRNGFSLSNQIYFYHNVRCRQEMLDRDIMLLQEAATLMDANVFIIHLLNKFNLILWAKEDFEQNYLGVKGTDDDNIKQTVILAEEFLLLVMRLVSERHTPGIGQVTEADCIKKEIIQLLCIEPMPHSVLNKALPEGVNHETGIEKVVDEVAEFKKASPEAKGFFELKKEYYVHYNLFFYHYSREEQSKSEVGQRNRKKAMNQEVCCPPPIPPPFTEAFTLLVNILQCDVFLHLAKIVLQRFAHSKSPSVSEAQLQIILHLIGYALNEEERFIKNADPYFRFTSKASKYFLLPLLEYLVSSLFTTTHKDLLQWTIKRYHEVALLSTTVSNPTSPVATPIDSPGVSNVHTQSAERKRKADIVAERKALIMRKMASMQKNFILNNEDLFKDTPVNESGNAEEMPSISGLDAEELICEDYIAVGPYQTLDIPQEQKHTCMLCHQDDSAVPFAIGDEDCSTSPVMVLAALCQKSTVLSRDRSRVDHILNPDLHDPLVLSSDLHWGANTSSCGHAMHAKCWQRYFDDVLVRERRKPPRIRQNLSFDIEENEYLCPLCESVCNTALPILPSVTTQVAMWQKNNQLTDTSPDIQIHHWIKALKMTLDAKSLIRTVVNYSTGERSSTEAGELKGAEGSTSAARSGTPPPSTSSPVRTHNAAFFLQSRNKHWHRSLPFSQGSSKKGEADALKVTFCAPPTLESILTQIEAEISSNVAKSFQDLFKGAQATSCPQFSRFTNDYITGFAHAIYVHGLCVNPECENPRIPLAVWSSTAYTIHVLEEFQRNQNRALFTSIRTRQLDSLVALVHFAAYTTLLPKMHECIESSCLRLLCMMLDSPCSEDSLCLLEWDSFGLLCSLVLSMPSLFGGVNGTAKGGKQDLFLLQICFFSVIVQSLLSIDESLSEDTFEMDEDVEKTTESLCPNGDFLAGLLGTMCSFLKLAPCRVNPEKLLAHVMKCCLPFLRCCGLFFHCLTQVNVPEELQSSVWVPESEFLCLLRYLGLSTKLKELFGHSAFKDVLRIWCSHPRINKVLEGMHNSPCGLARMWSPVDSLINLPHDYSELINTVSQFPCPASIGDDSRTPTMCLVCGKMLCSQSYCCQMELPEGSSHLVGACTHHAHHCGAGTGIFLRVRECRILLLCGRIKGCYIPPPYLDDYGETDHMLKRGNPLHLDPALYTKLYHMWLSHSIPDVIAHTMESSNNLILTEWFNF